MRLPKRNRLTITIGTSAHDIFTFLLNPSNTPLWAGSIVREEVSEFPAREGTVYRNLSSDGVWNEYTITSFEQDKTFIMRMKDGNYHVQYTLRSVSDTQTELEYYEWVIRGLLPEPYTQEILEKLKSTLENSTHLGAE